MYVLINDLFEQSCKLRCCVKVCEAKCVENVFSISEG